jgi:hypothetical protein
MMRTALALSLVLSFAESARAADASLRRFALVAGASLGGPERVPLRFATADARAVSTVFRRLGGVARDDLLLLEEPDADRLRSAIATMRAEVDRARSAGRRVEVFLYYSGHSDEEGLLLGGSRLTYTELRGALDAFPADVRVAILDSCASGAFTRTKGGVHRPPFLLDEASRVKGHAFLTSSAAHEAAQESDRLRASFFTHALVTGLRGAADAGGDGLVTLNEAYQFAFRETLAGTEATQGGPQHATYDIGLVGSGDVIMTDLRSADALLVIPESLDGRVFVRNSMGHLVAELRKVRGTRIDLALEEGRYDVRITKELRVLAGSVELVASGRAVLDETRLATGALEPTTSRGPDPVAEQPPPGRPPSGWIAVRGGFAVAFGVDDLMGLDTEIAGGMWLVGEWVGLEVATGYYRAGGRTKGRLPGDGIFRDGTAVVYKSDADVHDDVATIPATVGLKLSVPSSRVRPHLAAGAGIYYSRWERRPAQSYVWLAPGAERLHDEALELGVHLAVGASIRLSPRVSASVEARYVAARSAEVFQEAIGGEALRTTGGVQLSF